MQQLAVTLTTSTLGKQMLLKFCLLLTEEIASQGPRRRTDLELQRNTQIRDAMRADGDNALLCCFWRETMAVTADSEETVELVAEALKCVAEYSHWIDVNLVVEAESLRLLYQCLQSPIAKIQLSAAHCLGEIVLKGMPVRDKIALSKYLNLDSVFMAVINRGVVDSFCASAANILNNLGVGLGQSVNGCAIDSTGDRALVVDFYCDSVLKHLLSFIRLASMTRSDESLLLLVNVSSLLSMILVEARAHKEDMRAELSSFLQSLLPLVLHLLPRFLEEVNVEDMGPEHAISASSCLDEDEGIVLSTLLQAFDAIAWIMTHVTMSALRDLLSGGLENVPLSQVDLLSVLLLRFPEAIKGCPVFVVKIDGNAQKSPTAELLASVFLLPIRRSGLKARQWLFIARLIARYSSTAFFDVLPEEIEPCLQVMYRWLEMGSWSNEEAGELLLRMCRNLKSKLGLHSMGLLNALQPAMAVGRVKCAAVYEICGLAVATLDGSVVSLASASESLLGLVVRQLSSGAQNPVAEHVRWLEFVGAFARGFVSDLCCDPAPVRNYFMTQVLPVLETSLSRNDALVAVAVISTTQRLIPLCQADMVPLIRSIARATCATGSPLFGDASVLQDLLPLTAASLFKLRDAFTNGAVLGALWPTIEDSCLQALRRAPQGTDDWVQMGGMLRALLALVLALMNSAPAAEVTVNAAPQRLEMLAVSVVEILSLPGASTALPESAALYRVFISLTGKVLQRVSPACLCGQLLPRIYQVLLPAAITETYPLPMAQMRQSEEAVRKHLASLPATQHQLVHEAAVLLRLLAAQQPNLLAATGLPPAFLASNHERLLNRASDIKDLKAAIFILYLSQ